MGKRAGKKRTEKRKLIHAIKQARVRDEEAAKTRGETSLSNLPPLLREAPPPARTLPKIREQLTLKGLPPLVKLMAKISPTMQKAPSPDPDTLNLFPEELDRDLGWSPDEFDREYFRLWREEGNREWRRRRDRKRKRIIDLFGIDSDIEREIERDRRRDLEEDLFGDIISTDEEIEVEEKREGSKRMEVEEEEKREVSERMEVEEEEKREVSERMEVEEEEKKEGSEGMEVEEEERELVEGMEIGKREKEPEAKREAGARRVVVPNKIRGHWLKSKTRLDLSISLR